MNKKVVVFGGGTGMSYLLKGLKQYPLDITAVVSVCDDGGSTGILRDELDMLAVGDIRKVLIAMSKKEGSPDSRDINSTYPQAHMFANYIAVGDFDHHPLFFRDVPAFMSDKDAKLIGIPYVEIWKRGQ